MEDMDSVNESASQVDEGTQDVSQDSSTGNQETQSSIPEDWSDVPFGKHPRFQEMVHKNRTLNEQVKSWTQKSQDYESKIQASEQKLNEFYEHEAVKLWNFLAKNPDKYTEVQKLLNAQNFQTQESQPNPYATKYDELTTQKFKEVDELKREFQQREQQTRAQEEQVKIQTNIQQGTQIFEKLCAAEKITDERSQEVLSSLVITKLLEVLPPQDLVRATPEMLKEAFKKSLPTFNAIRMAERKTLSQIPNVPASGSRTGVPPRQDGFGDARERVNYLASVI